MQQKTPKILHNIDEIRHIVCSLRMTLNKYDENDDYVCLLKYKNSPETLISKAKIYSLFNKPLVFIPNVDGILCKDPTNKIINPTRLWLSWDKIPLFIDKAKILQINYIDSKTNEIPENEICYFFNEHFLIIRQAECIHWKMREEAIKVLNSATYKIFMDQFGKIEQFGKNQNQAPTVDDFVQYMEDVGHTFDPQNPKAKLPLFLTYLINIEQVQKYIDSLENEKKEQLINSIHPSIKHLFDGSTNNTNKSKGKKHIHKKN